MAFNRSAAEHRRPTRDATAMQRALPGDVVRVRPYDEIAGTLDADGTTEGLPFAPEMRQYCGREMTIDRRLNRMIVEGHGMRRIEGVVTLVDARCDGSVHNGCQRLCLLLWKEAWLAPVLDAADMPDQTVPSAQEPAAKPGEDVPSMPAPEPIACQGRAEDLLNATARLPRWDASRYLRDLRTRSLPPAGLARMCFFTLSQQAYAGRRRGGRLLRRLARLAPAATRKPEPAIPLNLKAGEVVEVKSRKEILSTLDAQNRTRGLCIMPEVWRGCGRTFRVLDHMEQMIVEPSGREVRMKATVALEGSVCNPEFHGGCSRRCYVLWREDWLKRVEAGERRPAGEGPGE